MNLHALAHVIVENQLAEDLPEARRALERLLGEGLDRHDAIHAIASVLMGHFWNLLKKPQGPGDPNVPYLAALENSLLNRGAALANGKASSSAWR